MSEKTNTKTETKKETTQTKTKKTKTLSAQISNPRLYNINAGIHGNKNRVSANFFSSFIFIISAYIIV